MTERELLDRCHAAVLALQAEVARLKAERKQWRQYRIDAVAHADELSGKDVAAAYLFLHIAFCDAKPDWADISWAKAALAAQEGRHD